MALDLRTSQQRAIAKAVKLNWHRQAEQFTESRWMIASATSRTTFYFVINHGRDHWSCNCEAGKFGIACYHAASCWLASVRDSALGRRN